MEAHRSAVSLHRKYVFKCALARLYAGISAMAIEKRTKMRF
jgi:hypothetical protein